VIAAKHCLVCVGAALQARPDAAVRRP
jgi:hypothetical protein